ncbi:MAG: pyridoxamine 5'-phosphate oxidase [Sporichthyaceae bacterium]
MGDLAAMREDYRRDGLDVGDLPADPIAAFRRWFDDAVQAHIVEPNAFVLGTVGPGGRPSARTVLAKTVDERGFVFYTNYASGKASELEANPLVSLLFPWYPLARQVRVVGRAARVSAAETAAYFTSRPRASQLGAWASHQSQVIPDRDGLERRWAELAARWPETTQIPVPDFWGGYLVEPDEIEFWQGRTSRLHDRLRYTRTLTQGGATWTVERLAP